MTKFPLLLQSTEVTIFLRDAPLSTFVSVGRAAKGTTEGPSVVLGAILWAFMPKIDKVSE